MMIVITVCGRQRAFRVLLVERKTFFLWKNQIAIRMHGTTNENRRHYGEPQHEPNQRQC